MERLMEGITFREHLGKDGNYFALFTVASADLPDQKVLTGYWPCNHFIKNWHEMIQDHFGGDDVNGIGFAIDIKRMHPAALIMSINVTQYFKSYDEVMLPKEEVAIKDIPSKSISWITAADIYYMEATYRQAIGRVKFAVEVNTETRHF